MNIIKILLSILLIVGFILNQDSPVSAQAGEGNCCDPNGTEFQKCADGLICDQYAGSNGSSQACSPTFLVCRAGQPTDPAFNLPTYGRNGIPSINFAGGGATGLSSVGSILNASIPYIFVIAGLLLFFYLLYGAFTWLTSMGNPSGISAGSSIMTRALIGFTIVFASYWVVQIIEIIWGLDII